MTYPSHHYTVLPEHSAQHIGSGGLSVLSTPMVTAYIENTAYLYCQEQLEVPFTTVGSMINIKHLAPTAINQIITVKIITVEHTGKQYHFTLQALENDRIIATAEHTRVVVDVERFMKRL